MSFKLYKPLTVIINHFINYRLKSSILLYLPYIVHNNYLVIEKF